MKPIHLNVDGYVIRSLKTEHPDERAVAYRLRYRVFVEELGWLEPSKFSTPEEEDAYDPHAHHVGVFNKTGRLIGYVRFLPPDQPFMLEEEFRNLLDGTSLQKDDRTVEISRLATVSCDGLPGQGPSIPMLLYKGIYHWLHANEILHAYMVVEERYHRLLELAGMPLRRIGQRHEYQPGTVTVALHMDVAETRAVLDRDNPNFLHWLASPHYVPIQARHG